MEEVFIILGMLGIISGTVIRLKKMSLERERMRLMAVRNGDLTEDEAMRGNFMGKLKKKAQGKMLSSDSDSDVKALEYRLQNIETIVTDPDFHLGRQDNSDVILRKLDEMNRRLDSLERNK
jgi:hypothetical protein